MTFRKCAKSSDDIRVLSAKLRILFDTKHRTSFGIFSSPKKNYIPENADAKTSNQNSGFSSIRLEIFSPNRKTNNFKPCNLCSALKNFSIFSFAGRFARIID
jgi:hypothetical protein